MIDTEIETLRTGGIVVDTTLETLQIRLPHPTRIHPSVLFMGVLSLLNLSLLPVLVFINGPRTPQIIIASLILFFVLVPFIAYYYAPKHAAELTLTDKQLILPRRTLALADILEVTFLDTEGAFTSGLQLKTAEETIRVQMNPKEALRGPLVRVVRHHVARQRAVAAESKPVPASLQTLREQ